MPKFTDLNPVTEIFPRGVPVSKSDDLVRILQIPRRQPLDLNSIQAHAMIEHVMAKYTKDNTNCGCSAIDPQIKIGNRTCIKKLLPVQAWALYEIGLVKGLVGAVPVGGGKTILNILALLAVGEPNGLLLVPPNLLDQLIIDYQLIDQHFHVPGIIIHMAGNKEWRRLVSGRPILHVLPYSLLQGKNNSDWIDRLNPKAIIADEVDGLADLGSARTKRIIRYFTGNERMTQEQRIERSRTKFCCWTGSLTDKSITEFCLSPEMRVLTRDLRWARSDEIKVGDHLVSFDEDLNHAKMRVGTVQAVKKLKQPRVKITTTKGTLICSTNHKWVYRGQAHTYEHKGYSQLGLTFGGRAASWRDAKDLKAGDLIGYYTDTWETDNSRDASYLAGLYDGEGWVHHTTVGIAQNDGIVFNEIKRILNKLNFEFTLGKSGKCNHVKPIGLKAGMKLLGTIRPPRLLDKADKLWVNRAPAGKNTDKVRVLSVEVLTPGEVVAIQTDTGTLVAEGFLSHNCHLSAFALKENSPLPLDQNTAMEWARCVDAVPNPSPPGALQLLCNPGESPRQAVGRRIRETMGFIVTGTSEVRKPGSIELVGHKIIEREAPPIPDIITEALDKVRNFQRPDTLAGAKYDEELVEAMDQARCAQQIATGMFYRWIFPRQEPDKLIDEWFAARKDWNKDQRYQLFQSDEFLDSPGLLEDAAKRAWGTDQVVMHDKHGNPYPEWKAASWPRWRAVKDQVQPKSQAVRLHDFLVRDAVDWGLSNNGIIWYAMIEFAQWMKELSGLPVHDGGRFADQALRRETGDRSIIASIKSNHRGRNGLQYLFNKQLVTQIFASARVGEQLFGRIHRQGQKHDVTTEIYLHTPEIEKSFRQALMRAKYNEETLQQKQKLTAGWFDEEE